MPFPSLQDYNNMIKAPTFLDDYYRFKLSQQEQNRRESLSAAERQADQSFNLQRDRLRDQQAKDRIILDDKLQLDRIKEANLKAIEIEKLRDKFESSRADKTASRAIGLEVLRGMGGLAEQKLRNRGASEEVAARAQADEASDTRKQRLAALGSAAKFNLKLEEGEDLFGLMARTHQAAKDEINQATADRVQAIEANRTARESQTKSLIATITAGPDGKAIASDLLRNNSATKWMTADQKLRLSAFAQGRDDIPYPNGTFVKPATPEEILNEVSQPSGGVGKHTQRAAGVQSALIDSIARHTGKESPDAPAKAAAFTQLQELNAQDKGDREAIHKLMLESPGASKMLRSMSQRGGPAVTGPDPIGGGMGYPALKDIPPVSQTTTGNPKAGFVNDMAPPVNNSTPTAVAGSETRSGPFGFMGTPSPRSEPVMSGYPLNFMNTPASEYVGRGVDALYQGAGRAANYIANQYRNANPKIVAPPLPQGASAMAPKIAAAKAKGLAAGMTEEEMIDIWNRAQAGDLEAIAAIDAAMEDSTDVMPIYNLP